MGAPHIYWTPEWDAYLRRKYPHNSNEKCLTGLRRKGYASSLDAMARHARQVLGLSKTPEYHARERARAIALCLERRGEDFPERQRQRALSGHWWGGKHNNGNNLTREQRAAMARHVFHTGDVEARAHASRRKTLARDRRRRDLGLEPLTDIHNLGDPMTHSQRNIRYQMHYECGYKIFRGDKRVYYDDTTRRSQRREATAESRGVYVYHISQRELFNTELKQKN